ncbi:Submandibular glandular kallikrein-9 [Homalodisca vitripennis]|nr:Submandibular glandular kallikrein-9 [Homalodisca vitripennis]
MDYGIIQCKQTRVDYFRDSVSAQCQSVEDYTNRVPQGDLSFRVEGTKCEKAGQLFTADKVLENVNYTGTWDYDIAVVKLNKPIKFGKHVKINFWTQGLANVNYTGTWDYDIAVVKLNKPIKFGKHVKPIKLGTKSLKPTTKVAIAGWGAASQSEFKSLTLLAAKVTVYDWNKCEETFSSYLTPRVMCTYDTNVGPCASDFGDPLVYKNAVYGLYAGGYDCLFDPAAYVNVPSYVDWVKNTIEKTVPSQVGSSVVCAPPLPSEVARVVVEPKKHGYRLIEYL